MTPDDIALDFMTESEIAEIMATEDIFQVDMTNLDDLLEDVASDSDYEQQLDSPRWCVLLWVQFPQWARVSEIQTLTKRKAIMYIEITDTIAIIIALTTSTTLVITTAIRNAKLTRALRELSVQK